jgi:hypothetical protein
MKNILNACIYLGLLALAAGCKRDLPNPTLHSPSGVMGLTASSSNITLSPANDSVTVVSFKWQAGNYGTSVPVTYTLLIDQPSDTSGATPWGNAFKTTITTDSLSISWLGTDFNHLLNILGLPDGQADTIVVRLMQDIVQSSGSASTVSTLHSDISMIVNPYHVVLIFPKLYFAGDFLNPQWTQLDKPGWILASPQSNGVFEGYVNFANSANQFKLCSLLSWNGDYFGLGSTQTTLAPGGSSGNLWYNGPAYARVVADTNKHTISYTNTSWVVAGDFNSWSITANPMAFNATTNTWVATGVNLTAGGQWKFVGDNAWNNCFGQDSKGNFVYGNGSVGNFKTTKAGTYTITLDLSKGAGNYTYSIQ